MRIARLALIGMMALLWVPLASHCSLEVIPGLEFLRCAQDTPSSSPKENHGCDESCCSFESAKYQTQRLDNAALISVVAPNPWADMLDVTKSLPQEVCLGILTAAPPEISQTWQFSFRTALPARAPSIAS